MDGLGAGRGRHGSKVPAGPCNIVFQANPAIVCRGCPEAPNVFAPADSSQSTAIDIQPLALNVDEGSASAPSVPIAVKRYAPQVVSPQTAFLIDSMLKDVVLLGTARRQNAPCRVTI